MATIKINRGDIVMASTLGRISFYGVVEYLEMSDGTIINSHDNIITGNGDENTKITIFVRCLYESLERFSDTYKMPKKIQEKIVGFDPHYIYLVEDSDVNEIEDKWNKKIAFLRSLKNNKPQITEMNL